MEHGVIPGALQEWIRTVLAEDLGSGDVTTNAVVPVSARGRMRFQAKTPLVTCGMETAAVFFTALDPGCLVESAREDGADAGPGDILLQVSGPARALLSAERSALNLAQHLCGVASLTRKFADLVQGTGARIAATRKTMPLLRSLEKYAVRAGGGITHRFGLSDGVLIKENHIVMAGSITEAVSRARQKTHHLLRIQVEVTDEKELEQALDAGAELVLLDNMDLDTMRRAVRLCRGHATVEASGNVTLENVRQIAETGVDIISSGALTHSAPAADVSAGMDQLNPDSPEDTDG